MPVVGNDVGYDFGPVRSGMDSAVLVECVDRGVVALRQEATVVVLPGLYESPAGVEFGQFDVAGFAGVASQSSSRLSVWVFARFLGSMTGETVTYDAAVVSVCVWGRGRVRRSLLVAALLVWGLSAGSDAGAVAGYGDVAVGKYFVEPVQWSADEDITGLDGACFGPDTAVSRGDAAVYLWNMQGRPTAGVPAHGFGDVTAGGDAGSAVSWMVHNKITTGTSATTFTPDRVLTRAEVVTFLWRLAGNPAAAEHSFDDVAATWQQGPVSWAAHNEITTGTSATTFTPDRALTRAEVVTFLWRYNNTPTVTVDPASPVCAPNPGEAEEAEQPSDASVQLNAAMDGGGIISASRGWCVVKTSGTLTCWNADGSPMTGAPAGLFTAVSAGPYHTCAIRTDSTITCWWNNTDYGQSPDPAGTFTTVSAGLYYTCAIRTDSTITCWGGYSGQSDAPAGTFTTVSVGENQSENHACAIRTDSTITCWGNNDDGQSDAPAGTFTTVSAGGYHTCAIRTDSTITCWGSNEYGQSDAPAGTFTAVSAGPGHTCAIRTDSTITCWPDTFTVAQQGTFTAVSAGFNHNCGIWTDGRIGCWGRIYSPGGLYVHDDDRENPGGESAIAPGGEIVSAGFQHSCGLLADRTVACWGSHLWGKQEFALGVVLPSGQLLPVAGGFLAVSVGAWQSCGLRTDQTITCSGRANSTPAGRFLAVSAGDEHSCGLLVNQTLTCWGSNKRGQRDAPEGRFLAISAGGRHSCGLLVDQTITCWGSDLNFDNTLGVYHDGRSDAPTGRFLAVSAGGTHSCGLLVDQTITCWGGNQYGQRDAPAGRFLAVSAGRRHSCGLRVDQTVTCWGSNFTGQRDAPRLRFLNEADTSASASVLIPTAVSCQRQAPSEGEPARPADVQIVRINVLDREGRPAQPVTVGWTSPCSGGPVDHYVVEWRRSHEGFGSNRQLIVQSSEATGAYSLEIPDLGVYAVRVTAVNRHGQSRSAEAMVPTPANEVRALLERVVVTFEGQYPWLSEVGTRMHEPDFEAVADTCRGGAGGGCASGDSYISITGPIFSLTPGSPYVEEARRKGRTLDLIDSGSTAVHEMAHVYHQMTDLTVNPPAIAAGWMYVADFLKDRNLADSCATIELYADIPGMLMHLDGLSGWANDYYWVGCRYHQQGGSSSWPYDDSRWQEMVEVMRSVYVDQEVPRWFYDTYQRADGSWDVDAIKAILGDPDSFTFGSLLVRSTFWQLRQLIPEL